MKLFKISFAPVMGNDDHGNPVVVGRYMTYVTAPSAAKISEVISVKLKEFDGLGFEVEEQIPVPDGHSAWSINIGPIGRAYSMVITAPSEPACRLALEKACEGMPYVRKYVEMELFRSTKIDLSVEGVW